MKNDLSKVKAAAFAKAVLGTAKGLTCVDDYAPHKYHLVTGRVEYRFSLSFFDKWAAGDIVLNIEVEGAGMGTCYYKADTFELDYDANDKHRHEVQQEYCDSCDLYLDHKAAEYRRNKTDWKYGTLFYNGSVDRYDIDFDKGGTYGGLHCGACFDIMVNGKWEPTRIEFSDVWYLIDAAEGVLTSGAKVRI